MEVATIENIKIGIGVIDVEDGMPGIVISCNDPHNVEVKFENGRGFWCLVPDCPATDLGTLKIT